jgi:hypothetical protein
VRFWLGVISREHVSRAVEAGIGQIGHGRRPGLARMHRGDWLIYYSPHVNLAKRRPLRAFTAIGQIADEEIWQADEGDFKPWRRRVTYETGVRDAELDALRDRLALTSGPNWGHQLRRGLVELSPEDFTAIRAAMGAAG